MIGLINGAINGALASVLIVLLVCITALTGFVYFNITELRKKQLERNPKKRTIIPTKAYAEPGVCMCGDAINFHHMGGKCNVEGCPCLMFVPSDAEDEVLKEIGMAGPSRLAIESINIRMDADKKRRAIEGDR